MAGRPPGTRTIALAWLGLLAAGAGCSSSPIEPTPVGPPALSCPLDLSLQSASGLPVVASYVVPTPAGGESPVTVGCLPASGASFPPGTTTVTCTATDRLARTATCGFAVKVSVPPRLKFTKFMAFGDSMTSGKPGTLYASSVEDYLGSYPSDLYTALVARYTTQVFTMSKQGWPGEPTSIAVTRLQATLPTVRPEVVLLMDGANDLSGGDEYAVAPAVENMIQMVGSCRSAGSVVFLAKLPPQRAGLKRAGGAGLVQTYNAALAPRGTAAGATIVDLYAALSTDVAAYISDDGLHPTTAGYQKIADTFFASIQQQLESPGITPAATMGDRAGAWFVNPGRLDRSADKSRPTSSAPAALPPRSRQSPPRR